MHEFALKYPPAGSCLSSAQHLAALLRRCAFQNTPNGRRDKRDEAQWRPNCQVSAKRQRLRPPSGSSGSLDRLHWVQEASAREELRARRAQQKSAGEVQAPKRQVANDSKLLCDFAKVYEAPVITCQRAGRSKTTSTTDSAVQKSLPRTRPRKRQ